MILSFKEQFKKLIIQGVKIHSIREDKPNRWKKGNTIHFATGVRTKNYDCFDELTCVSVQSFSVKYNMHPTYTRVCFCINEIIYGFAIFTNCELKEYSKNIHDLAINDGFKDVNEFLEWFSEDFEGKIIHWTHKRY